MKLCKYCNKKFRGARAQLYCSPECKKKSKSKECPICKRAFYPLDVRAMFCSRHCSMKSRMSDKSFVARIVAKRDLEEVGRKVKEYCRLHPEARRKAGEKARSRAGEVQSAIVKRSWEKRRLLNQKAFGANGNGHPPTPQEAALLKLFPEAIYNHSIPTRLAYPKNKGWYCMRPDLSWPNVKLAVEVDGETHTRQQQIIKDQRKDKRLRELGWTVLRFANDQVSNNIERVQADILSTISKLKATRATA